MHVQPGDVVLPGDIVRYDPTVKTIVGPGLRMHAEQLMVTSPGLLKTKRLKNSTYWVDSHQKRYVPVRSEYVIGIITSKAGDVFKVDIGSSEQACLSYLAFEGATKKYRPDVQVGNIIFGRLSMDGKDTEPELVCVDSFGKAGRLGPLSDDGFMFTCSLNLVRKILCAQCPLLKILGKELPHEIAVGHNGRVWVKSQHVRWTIGICNAILASERLTYEEITKMCDNIIGSILL